MTLARSLFLLLAVASVAGAQTLTLEQAIDAALANEPSLALAAAEADAAEAAAGIAASALDPQVDLNASLFHHDEPMVVSPIHGFTPGTIPEFDQTLIQSSVTGRWLLWDGGAARARVAESEARAEAARAGTGSARQGVIAATIGAYLRVQAAADVLAAEQRRLDALEVETRRVALLLAAGRVAEVDRDRAEAAREAADAERVAARARLDLAERRLARLTGLPAARTGASNLAGVSARAEAPGRAAVLERALGSSARIEQARRVVASEQAALAAARGARRPTVHAASSILEYGSGSGDFTVEWNAGLQLRFSLFDGGAADQRVAAAAARVRAAEARLAMLERDVADEVDAALADLERSAARVRSLARAEAGFAEVARVERLRLEAGVGTQAEYLRAEADLVGARAALAGARAEEIATHAELERIAGTLDAGWARRSLE